MYKETDKEFSFETSILREGAYINQLASNPESAPIYLTTAFNVEDLDDLYERYEERGFCYNRNRNPNRSALGELMTYTENGEESIIFSSGMAAIATTIITCTKAGDHIISDKTLYGETIEIFTNIMEKYQVRCSFVDFTDLDAVKNAMCDNTVMLYTETISNPMITVPDLREISNIAHLNQAILVVDNTFMTAFGIRPLDFGADIVVNSLTKFANGHSDAVCGSATGKKAMMEKIHANQVLLGSTSDAFSSWLVARGMRTLSLRLEKQMANASILAAALEKSPYVKKVYHPSLTSHPQHALAIQQFGDCNHCGAMLSIVLEDDKEKMNLFMRKLNLAHYAMTLGGYRTTLSHPVSSSHYDTPEEERQRMGITWGLLRISTGIEKSEELVQDFMTALEVYADKKNNIDSI